MLSAKHRRELADMIEGRRGQGRIVKVRGGGKTGDLVNAANGARASLTNGINTLRGALNQVVKTAMAAGRDDVSKHIASLLHDIEQAEEELRSVLGTLDSPSRVAVESAGEPTWLRWLQSQKRKVTPEQKADFSAFLKVLSPTIQNLEKLLQDHGGRGRTFPEAKWSRADTDKLWEALRILATAEVPLSSLDTR